MKGRVIHTFLAVILGLVLAALAVLLSRIKVLDDSNWWYPETDLYQLWFLALAGLLFLSQRTWDRGRQWRLVLSLVWAGVAALVLSGLIDLMQHIIFHRTPGDLLQNYLEGARRLVRGHRVYDLAGLQQGVNASPLIIGLLRPLARLSDPQAISVWLAVTLACFGLYFTAGCLLVRHIKGWLTIPDAGLVLAAATTFATMQRSWRLGQLDTLLLALLACGLLLLPSRKLSAVVVGLAAGLKILPALFAAPILLLAGKDWLADRRFGAGITPRQRWAAIFIASILLLALLATALVGLPTATDFARNVHRISASTTSGNNYSFASRLATLGDRDRHGKHLTLSAGFRWMGRIIAALTIALLAMLTWQRHRADALLLSSLWLAALPLISPICWDIYLLWCSFLPWLVLWSYLTSSTVYRGQGSASRLILVAAVAAYYLVGVGGNTTTHNLDTGVTAHLNVPLLLDELPLLGQTILLVLLALAVFRSHRLNTPH